MIYLEYWLICEELSKAIFRKPRGKKTGERITGGNREVTELVGNRGVTALECVVRIC